MGRRNDRERCILCLAVRTCNVTSETRPACVASVHYVTNQLFFCSLTVESHEGLHFEAKMYLCWLDIERTTVRSPWMEICAHFIRVRPTWVFLLKGLNVHSSLVGLIRYGGKLRDGYLCPTTYSLHCHHQNDSALRRAAVWDNVSWIVWAKSPDSVHKPLKESRNGLNRDPSAYQHSALPLGHTGWPFVFAWGPL